MKQDVSWRLLLLVNALVPISCIIYATGFFPHKPFISGFAEHELDANAHKVPAHFDKIIFMVVDALRSDFVFSQRSGFHFTHSLVENGSAIPFTAFASSPTVTMPRIKALTTGSIPSFVDMILNVAESETASTLALQDSWLAQMQRKPHSLAVMYGDDTWLKLFPNSFSRADGTSSFFVADFTEVDNNVTRHVPEELAESDWNVMVLHYLGLDHIGHKSGPHSHHMLPKHLEMDNIVKQVYFALENSEHLKTTLFVLAGDHGMNDAGNHGGSSAGETSPAMVFISPKLQRLNRRKSCPTTALKDFDYYQAVQQSDLSPTLAALLGFPIPRNSLGIFIDAFLPMWKSKETRVQILLANARQLLKIVQATYPNAVFSQPDDQRRCTGALTEKEGLLCAWKDALHFSFIDSQSEQDLEAAIQALYKFCEMAQRIISSSASNYKTTRLWTGMAVVATALMLSMTFCMSRPEPRRSLASFTFALISFSYPAMMFASSFVEEEQEFWYWITSAWLSLQIIRRNTRHWASAIWLLVLLRIARRWNQSGQKHQGSSDIAQFFMSESTWSRIALLSLIVITYVRFGHSLYRMSFKASGLSSWTAGIFTCFILFVSALFKMLFVTQESPELLGRSISMLGSWTQQNFSLVLTARLVLASLALATTLIFVTKSVTHDRKAASRGRFYSVLLQLLVLQVRTTSIPLLLILHAAITTIPLLNLDSFGLVVTSITFAKYAYFSFGGTNAISSLDLSLAYNGISSYNPLAVGAMLVVTNFGMAMLASAAIISGSMARDFTETVTTKQPVRADKEENGKAMHIQAHDQVVAESQFSFPSSAFYSSKEMSLISLWISAETIAIMAGCTWLREHLFIWTVFSPRLLYQAAWVIIWHLLGNFGLGSALRISQRGA